VTISLDRSKQVHGASHISVVSAPVAIMNEAHAHASSDEDDSEEGVLFRRPVTVSSSKASGLQLAPSTDLIWTESVIQDCFQLAVSTHIATELEINIRQWTAPSFHPDRTDPEKVEDNHDCGSDAPRKRVKVDKSSPTQSSDWQPKQLGLPLWALQPPLS
jgi:hypothetical protein